MMEEITALMADLDEDRLLETVKREIKDGVISPMDILEACREGLRIVGERFEKGEYFISELIFSAEIFNNALAILESHLVSVGKGEPAGKIVFGTVKGDIHNIGKDIVISLLRADGFEVFDLGVDVLPETFVEKVKETGATILGLSGLITISYDGMKATVEALTKAGLREQVRIMIGGGLVNEQVRAYSGADVWGDNASAAVKLCRQFLKEAKND